MSSADSSDVDAVPPFTRSRAKLLGEQAGSAVLSAPGSTAVDSLFDLKETAKFVRSLKFPSLDGTNYPLWKFRVLSALRSEGLEHFLDAKPDLSRYPASVDCSRWTHSICNALVASIPDDILTDLSIIYDGVDLLPFTVWESLRLKFTQQAAARRATLRGEMESVHLDGFDSVLSYASKLQSLFSELRQLGAASSHEDQLFKLFSGLTADYRPAVAQIHLSGLDKVSFQDAVTLLHNYTSFCGSDVISGNAAAVDSKKPVVDTRVCYNCGISGHISRNCMKTKQRNASVPQTPPKSRYCHVCEKTVTHRVSDCPLVVQLKKERSAAGNAASVSPDSGSGKFDGFDDCMVLECSVSAFAAGSNSPEHTWLMDSGASRHMCWDRSQFSCLRSVPEPLHVRVATGKVVVCHHVGDILLPLALSGGITKSVLLKNVLFLPTFGKNLFSIPSALDNCHGKAEFTRDTCTIYSDPDGIALAIGDRFGSSGLYALRM